MLLLAILACNGADDPGTDDTSGTHPAVQAPPLVINEFLAANDTVNTDEAGEYDDWVEIYNTSDHLVQFAGLYLTDQPDTTPTRWAFPDGGGIDANGYALVWCDATPEQGSMHASFKLNKGGDELSIYYVEGGADPVPVDALDYDVQTPDLSFARVPDGTLHWVQGPPTPAASNG
jgi:hypothetical protein